MVRQNGVIDSTGLKCAPNNLISGDSDDADTQNGRKRSHEEENKPQRIKIQKRNDDDGDSDSDSGDEEEKEVLARRRPSRQLDVIEEDENVEELEENAAAENQLANYFPDEHPEIPSPPDMGEQPAADPLFERVLMHLERLPLSVFRDYARDQVINFDPLINFLNDGSLETDDFILVPPPTPTFDEADSE